VNGFASALELIAAACLGVYSGAMLTEGFVLVPWWRSLPAAEFFAWYAANDARLLAFFGPVTSVTAIAALASAVVSMWAGMPGRWLSVAALALVLTAVAMFVVYFEAANESFSKATITAEALPAELARWGALHHLRTVLSLAALACSLLALRRPA
jgi:uncharacterized membrane protein